MAKKRRPQPQAAASQIKDGEVPVVGAREPCPCGSGRRYKACHGRQAAHAATELVQRPFEGLPGECDWVALRELVPAATAELTLKGGLPEGVPSVTLATVLPMAWPALRRDNGAVLLGLQNDTASGDLSRDLADTLQRALAAEPGTPVAAARPAPDGPRLQDLLDPDAAFEPTVHTGFEFWVENAENATGEVAASLERANAAAIPTSRIPGLEGAYWCEAPEKNHLRWVTGHPEEQLLDALARLHAAGDSSLGEGTRLVGSFRAHGLVVPVWDLPSSMSAEDVAKPAAAFAERLAEALASDAPLSPEERRARGGLTNRQVTLS
ncbi:SEC-C domain-containing protein [Streptomyces sp. Je 1-4]|uniref:SEC-C domain-containing protein n=1 Tax=Streptomyces TaxID=1883 RepID=UPI0021DA8551|nr:MULTISPECIES: SEC-C domain-containing protein [unclassified Streptomyces]UYB41208.1 SEC-C domain-containing protein [Streptomyces sp. Je 1-4]UZQ37386.1 SEC-C domain-containing protein [Streptomyces sp. Je 1-4] [Streptomyces sp. Je 1-4 4N24]UZQ44803.1 SEC-C domain-containing protein [Streptomyces sp. Je 1-4] [Streptomyces sp. Je 1-4 4N24_ara]